MEKGVSPGPLILGEPNTYSPDDSVIPLQTDAPSLSPDLAYNPGPRWNP